jgi:hypothetical protein
MKEPQLPATITSPEYLGTLSDVLRFIVSVETLMETPYDSKDGNAVADRIADLVMLFPSSTKAIASVTFYRDETLKHTYNEMMKKAAQNDDEAIKAFKQASVITAIAKSRVAELNALLVYVERVNASITHSIDGMRSILSNLKEERRMMAGASYNP